MNFIMTECLTFSYEGFENILFYINNVGQDDKMISLALKNLNANKNFINE